MSEYAFCYLDSFFWLHSLFYWHVLPWHYLILPCIMSSGLTLFSVLPSLPQSLILILFRLIFFGNMPYLLLLAFTASLCMSSWLTCILWLFCRSCHTMSMVWLPPRLWFLFPRTLTLCVFVIFLSKRNRMEMEHQSLCSASEDLLINLHF